jgi:hypothetical protein
MLSNGEYVIQASSVGKYGKGFMDSVNAGTFNMGGMARKTSMPRYALGGYVGSQNVPMQQRSDSGVVYNISVNAGEISDPNKLASVIINRIKLESSRTNHSTGVYS